MREAAEGCRVALGERLVGAYALGSLAHGGFSELVSDIDLGLILSDPVGADDGGVIEAIAEREKAKGSRLHERLSVFWGTPASLRGELVAGRFPPLDRLDLIEHGRLLLGHDAVREELPRPSLEELTVSGARFALEQLAGVAVPGASSSADTALGSLGSPGEGATAEIRSPELLVAHGVRRLTKLVLFPVRFMFTASTGQVGSNDDAVAHYVRDERAPGAALVIAAHGWRTAAPDARQATALLRDGMVPLYLHFIEDHVRRLRSLHEDAVAGAFEEWRGQLMR